MGDRKAGPVCRSAVGDGWIDDGTSCRWRSGASGPLGVMFSLVFAAKPEEDADDPRAGDQGMLGYDIDYIADTKPGKTSEFAPIVAVLREKLKAGKIVYGKTLNGGRGDWDGDTIIINEDFRGQLFPTVLELVHEGSHALWRKQHPKGKIKETLEVIVEEEYQSRVIQLKFYRYLRDNKGCPPDMVLDNRQRKLDNDTLRDSIREEIQSSD